VHQASAAVHAVHAVQLTKELQLARERLVLAREEERRRLRHDLHDGLAPTLAAIQERAMQFSSESGVTVDVRSIQPLSPLPAAVDVVAYRITLEALMNVVRHAAARHCLIELSADAKQLAIRITDDGQGLRPDLHAGLGLASMRDRAGELGGTCTIEDAEPHGTRVIARLPPISR
jgi:signal transduction histidine kinase